MSLSSDSSYVSLFLDAVRRTASIITPSQSSPYHRPYSNYSSYHHHRSGAASWTITTAAGWTTAVSLTLILLRLVVQRVAPQESLPEEDHANGSTTTYVVPHGGGTRARAMLGGTVTKDALHLIRCWLKYGQAAAHQIGTRCKSKAACYSTKFRTVRPDMTRIQHTGSCHCQAVQFQVTAPRSLYVTERHGKMQYPAAIVRANSFRLRHGRRFLRNYHYPIDYGGEDRQQLAHSFCSHCGVPICSAANAGSVELWINVHCLDSVWIRHDTADAVPRAALAAAVAKAKVTKATAPSSSFTTPTKSSTGMVNEEKKTDRTTNTKSLFSPTTTNCLTAVTTRLLSGVNNNNDSTSSNNNNNNHIQAPPKSPILLDTAKSTEGESVSTVTAGESLSSNNSWTSHTNTSSQEADHDDDPLQQHNGQSGSPFAVEHDMREQLRRYMSKHLQPLSEN